jgi:HEAT repeat protein
MPGELGSRKKLTYDMAGFERDMVPVVPALVRALRDEDWNVAYHAAQSLGKLRLKPEVVVPALVEVAADKKANSVLRGEAIDTLGQLGHSAESAVPALVEVAKDGPGIAKHVKDALRWIDPEAIKQVEQITPATWASNRTSRYKR